MAKLTVLGIGNILMRDEGVGVHLVEAVRVARDWPEDVEFIDGGAGGLNLLTVIERAERLVVFDAAEMNLPAGTSRVVGTDQVRDETARERLSLHDAPFVETLRLCEQFLRAPEEVVIFAVQPAEVDHGRRLSPALGKAFDKLTREAVQLVERIRKPASET